MFEIGDRVRLVSRIGGIHGDFPDTYKEVLEEGCQLIISSEPKKFKEETWYYAKYGDSDYLYAIYESDIRLYRDLITSDQEIEV